MKKRYGCILSACFVTVPLLSMFSDGVGELVPTDVPVASSLNARSEPIQISLQKKHMRTQSPTSQYVQFSAYSPTGTYIPLTTAYLIAQNALNYNGEKSPRNEQ